MATKLIGLTGYAGSGKDTAAANMPGWTRVSFADPVREMAMQIDPYVPWGDTMIRLSGLVNRVGWTDAKRHSEVRRLLQRIGTEAGRGVLGESVWVDLAMRKVDAIDGPVVIADVRFTNEAAAIRQRGGCVVLIGRDNVGPVNGHVSEIAIDRIPVNALVENNCSASELGARVLAAFKELVECQS